MKGRRGDKGILGVPEHPVLPTGEHWVQREVVEGNRGRQEGRRTPYVGKGSGVLGSTAGESHGNTVIQRTGEGVKRNVSSKAG